MIDDNKYIDVEVAKEIERRKEIEDAKRLLTQYKGLIDETILDYCRTDTQFGKLLADALGCNVVGDEKEKILLCVSQRCGWANCDT